MPTVPTRLPNITTDLMVGICFVFARSFEPGTIQLFQVICPLQDEPTNTPESLYHVGNFRPADLLNWAYAENMCECGQFEAPGLWRYMSEQTGLDPMGMLALRPMLGQNLEALAVLANMEEGQLAAMFPYLPRAA